MGNERLACLSAAGVAVWLDDLSRERLARGELDHLCREFSVVGVTTNPTIFAQALTSAEAYADQVADLKARDIGAEEAARSLIVYDVRWACDIMRPVYDASHGVDGRVSIEVDPRFARDANATLAEARALWWLVDRPNLYIKIPATSEGLPAISQSLAEGISINATLIFSLQRYEEVMEAFLTGLERAAAAGQDLRNIGSVASFFVSRVDTEIDRRLALCDSPQAHLLHGRSAIANARLAYQRYERVFAGSRWQALAAAGARAQRPLWASTSAKDPSYRDVVYVEDLIAPGVVNTMPESTLLAFADHGQVLPGSITGSYADAAKALESLGEVGIDYDEVVTLLENQGITKFVASWDHLLNVVTTRLS